MKTYTDQQIAQMYDNLPEDLKDAIFSVEMSSVVEKIGRENQLNIEQIGDLANETGMVMLGVTHPDEFITNLAERLGVEKEKARAIAHEINDQIFKPVRDSLRKIHNIREENETKERNQNKVSPLENSQEETLKDKASREDIIDEIEKDHTKEIVMPDIMKGDTNPFEEKMKEGVFKAPTEEKHYVEEKEESVDKQPPENLPTKEKPKNYQAFDPYREPIE